MKIVLGSGNPAKLQSAQYVVDRLFSGVKVEAIIVPTGVSAQPVSDSETIEGAIFRARHAREQTDADFGIGMEGGMHQIGERWFECGWIAVVDRAGNVSLGSSARFEVPAAIIEQVRAGKELGEIIDSGSGEKTISKTCGAMGLLTNGHVPRADAYAHGLFFAFGPFVSDVPLFQTFGTKDVS